jgi:hypothetical protein
MPTGTLVGEENIYEYSSMTFSTCFCYLERSFEEALDVAMIFLSLLKRIKKKKSFPF